MGELASQAAAAEAAKEAALRQAAAAESQSMERGRKFALLQVCVWVCGGWGPAWCSALMWALLPLACVYFRVLQAQLTSETASEVPAPPRTMTFCISLFCQLTSETIAPLSNPSCTL